MQILKIKCWLKHKENVIKSIELANYMVKFSNETITRITQEYLAQGEWCKLNSSTSTVGQSWE